ncbi:MAG TPA: glutamate ABC transporter substrate-binding protein [Actinomycetota bacterium]|nr:glutamate ABC transporter substrate-binding protein [Actinomycetota bacterium]
MSRIRAVLISLVLCLSLVAAACGTDDNPAIEGPQGDSEAREAPEFEEGTTMAAIQERGTLNVGTKFDQPLFGQKNPITDEVEGFDVEIAKLVAHAIFGGTREEAADKVNFVETVSAVREAEIQKGSVDMIVATYTINDARKALVDFAGPYFIAGQDIMVMRDNNDINGVDDLNGKRVCSVQGSTSLRNLQEQAPQADTSISFERYTDCADAMRAGRVDAVTTDNVILLGLVRDNPNDFKVVENTFTEEPYGIGITKGDDAFRDFLNDTIEAAYEDGSWEEAFDATVGQAGVDAPEPPEVDRYTSTGEASPAPTPTPTGTPAASPSPTGTASPEASPTG